MGSVDDRVKELVSRFGAPDACLAELLCDGHDPDATAFTLVHEDLSTDTLTYGELRDRSERVAASLVELGVSAGDAVATLMGKSAEYLATLVAIWRLGAAHVPLFTAFAPPAIAMRLEGSAAKVVVTDSGQRSKLDAAASGATPPRRVVHLRAAGADLPAGDVDFHDLVSASRGAPSAAPLGGRGAMVRMYTSGTTGRPKGVAIPLSAMATWQLYLEFGLHVTDDDVFWCAADPGWAYGLFAAILAPLAAGRASILHEDKFTADATWRILSDLAVTNFTAAPTAWRALRVAASSPLVLRKASSAGEPLTPEVNEWSTSQLGINVHDHYGQTELGMVFCNHHHPDLRRPLKPGSMGIPLPGWSTGVLQQDSDHLAAPGELGRVAVDMPRSPTAWFDGYVDAPAATAEKFTADGRWYLTGDSGRTDEDGHYFFMSRDDDVIIMAGYRIGPFDVESIISTHPGVQECAVVAVPDQMKGEVIEAFVVLAQSVDGTDELTKELQQRVRENLGAHAYPRSVFYVDTLPKTPSGKIQRFVLRETRRTELATTREEETPMAVTSAELRRSPDDGSAVFVPYATDVPPLEDFDYVQEEWVATGEEDGRPYATTLLVRRPRDSARFSGTVIVEPLHVHGIAPVWIYTAPYIMRSGHGWAEVTAQKTTLDMHVKASNPERYGALQIEGPDTSDFDPNPRLGDPATAEPFWSELERRNRAASTILAQVGAAIRAPEGPFAGDVGHVILAGHSQTGSVTTYFIRDAHRSLRLADGSPVYDGFFPSGFPFEAFSQVDVPVVQVVSEGDVAHPAYSFRPGYGGRRYRRDDSDEPGDQFRLYELAGIPHMGTRVAPYNDVSLWTTTHPDYDDEVTLGPRMNSLPTFELFGVGLHHLVRWVADGILPPRGERLETGPDGYFAQDEHGNTRGGVRCVQLDVPHSTYRANPIKPDGRPSYITVGTDEPFEPDKLRQLYGDTSTYVERFNRRLDELIAEGWFLAEDADDMRREAQQVEIPHLGTT